MRKLRIIRDLDKWRVEVKYWNTFGRWRYVDYFYSEEQARSFIVNNSSPTIVYETDWIKSKIS